MLQPRGTRDALGAVPATSAAGARAQLRSAPSAAAARACLCLSRSEMTFSEGFVTRPNASRQAPERDAKHQGERKGETM